MLLFQNTLTMDPLRIFQGIEKIVDENEKQDWAEDNALGHFSLFRERRCEDAIESHVLATRVEEVRKPCVELASDAISRAF